MTTLITGAGQVGTQIARILLEEGQSPVVYDINPPLAFVETAVPLDRLKIIRGDVRDLARLIDVIRQDEVDTIIHTAGVLPPRSEEDVRLCVDVNVQGTVNVLRNDGVAS